MSRHESASWIVFLMVAGATAWLGWTLWASWPETGAFPARVDRLDRILFWTVVVAAFLVRYRYGRGGWSAVREGLAADERERAIVDAGNACGLAALALLQVVLGMVIWSRGGVPEGLDRDWIRYFLLLPVGIAFSIAFAYRVVRYRIG